MAGINKLPVITARQNNRLQMTTEIQEEFKAFLSIKKTVIYLSIVLLALIFLLLDWPGHSFMLVGIGLFYGHCIYRFIKYKDKTALKLTVLIIATALTISIIAILKFNPLRATSIILFFVLVSLIIEWKRSNFKIQKILILVALLIIASVSFYYITENDETTNSKGENDPPKEHVLIHHTRPKIQSEECILVWDSATAYMDINDFVTARKLLHRCNDIEPNNATILNTLGVSYFSNGDSTTALKYYFTAMKADSTKPEAYASAGCLLDMLRKPDEAIKILKIGYAKTNLDQFTHYNICFNLSIAYFHVDSCMQAKKYISIAKQHGFNEPQFDTQVQEVERAILEYCR
jgi:tetratricopeptide (TPR) repeat protein